MLDLNHPTKFLFTTEFFEALSHFTLMAVSNAVSESETTTPNLGLWRGNITFTGGPN